MKQVLENLRGAIAKRLDRQGGAPEGRRITLVGAQTDVRAAVGQGRYKWVIAVTLLVAVYYALFASDRYVTEAQLYVKSTNNAAPTVPQLSLLTAVGGQASDALVLQNYIVSGDMLRHLDETIDLKAHFSGRDWDMIARMSEDPTEEDFLDYFQGKVKVNVNPESAILTVTGEAFTPEYSQRLVAEILKEADRFINSVSQRIATEEIAFVDGELKRARDQMNAARDRMLAFQNENELLDPTATGAARQEMVNRLEGSLVELETERKVLRSYLNDTAPQVVANADRIRSVKQQLEEERRKLASQDTRSINEVNARFKELELEVSFASDLYQATLKGLEQARVESYHKLKHLVVLQSPLLPDEALAPRKLYNLATLFVILSLAYGIVTMILATIREHRDV